MDLNPPWWKVPLQLPLLPVKLFLKTPQKGAATQIHLCLSPQVQNPSKLFVPWNTTIMLKNFTALSFAQHSADDWNGNRPARTAAACVPTVAVRLMLRPSLLSQVEGVTGKYFVDCKPKSSSKASYDAATARRLWDVSKELTGAEDFF